MKRPQSANQKRNFWAQVSNDEGYADQRMKPHSKHNKKLLNVVSTSNDLSRLLPKRIPHDKERLYYETMQLKTSLNEVAEQNHRLKTKITVLQKEKDKISRVEDISMRRGGKSGLLGMADKENGIVSNLKRLVRQSKEESQNAKAELTKLKKTLRYTKINEIDVERQTLIEENKRQAKIIIHFQTKLEEKSRSQDQIDELEHQLKTRTQQLHQIAQDNARYEEIIEDLQMKNKELAEKYSRLEKKMQKDLMGEKKKVQQLHRANENLKSTNKALQGSIEEEKKKVASNARKIIRPVSSNIYQNQNKMTEPQSTKEKETALQINQKLQKQLLEAKKRLAESKQQLQKQEKTERSVLYDEPFELELTKKQVQQSKIAKQEKSKSTNEVKKQSNRPRKDEKDLEVSMKVNAAVQQQIKDILTCRMRYNRYSFAELKEDIQSSPIQSFAVKDLMTMLNEQPFFLSEGYAIQFLKLCLGSNKWNLQHQVTADILLKKLRECIAEFDLPQEEEEQQMLYQIADYMTQNRENLEKEFSSFKNPNKILTKKQLQTVLRKVKGLTQTQIELAICYASATSESLEKIYYQELLDKFYMNQNSIESGGKPLGNRQNDDDLSLGENQQIVSLGSEEEQNHEMI